MKRNVLLLIALGASAVPAFATVYGRIPQGQDSAVSADYADSVQATITY